MLYYYKNLCNLNTRQNIVFFQSLSLKAGNALSILSFKLLNSTWMILILINYYSYVKIAYKLYS
jgi:hypothetical protein